METKDVIVAFIIGIVILIILIAFYTRGFGKLGKVEKGFLNKTIEDPFAITGDATQILDTLAQRVDGSSKPINSCATAVSDGM